MSKQRPCANKHPTLNNRCLFCNKLLKHQKYRNVWHEDPILPSLPPIGPGLIQKAVNAAKAVVRNAANGFKRATKEQAAARIYTCRNCELFDGKICTHKQCGCVIGRKAFMLEERCPLNKWDTAMKWMCGVTTVDTRLTTYLPRTLASIAAAGFPAPRLFVDNCPANISLPLPASRRDGRMLTWGNWYLGLMELYLRDPTADRYGMFQDDVVFSKNVRAYLDRLQYPDNSYLNLYTFPSNAKGGNGFSRSSQRGLGAVALVFSRAAVKALLTSDVAFDRPQDAGRGHRAIDGGIVTALNRLNWHEYVHVPSLCQHIGDESSMGNNPHAKADTFRGEDFDCMELLEVHA